MSYILDTGKTKTAERYTEENVTHKFTPEQQLEIVRRIAWFWTNNELVKFAQKEYGRNITYLAIAWYKGSEKWKPIIERFREEYMTKLTEVPLFNKKKRLEELQAQYDFYKEKDMKKEARAIL